MQRRLRRGKDEMSKKLFRVLVPVLALGLVLTAVAVAGGATASKAPKKAKIMAEGKETFKVNKYFTQTFHYHAHKTAIASGGTITIVDKIGQDHTLSLVSKGNLPKTLRAANGCY